MALEPKEFNKPCLMSYGEIAERLTVVLQNAAGQGLMLWPNDPPADAQVVDLSHYVAQGLLKLEKVDLR